MTIEKPILNSSTGKYEWAGKTKENKILEINSKLGIV